MSGDDLDPVLAERVRRRLAGAAGPASPSAVASVLREETGGLVGDTALLGLVRAAQSEFVGAGPLEPLLADPETTDVLVNGPSDVWVDRSGRLERTSVRFADQAAVRRLAQRLAALAGRRLDEGQPWVDAIIGGGVRLHAVLPPIAADGVCISLRVMRRRSLDLPDLVRRGSVDAAGAALLRAIVAARLAFLITGGTGTGKTTLLNCLLDLVGPGERVVIVDDAGEVRPKHEHAVRLVTRPANVEGAGAVDLRALVRQALRMRPDRIVVGEVRGGEVVELLAALNTGHDGGCGTVHANSAAELPARLEALGVLGGLDAHALHSQAAAALQLVIHLSRAPGGHRRLAEVCVLDRAGDGRLVVLPGWRPGDEDVPGRARLDDLLRARGVAVGGVTGPGAAT